MRKRRLAAIPLAVLLFFLLAPCVSAQGEPERYLSEFSALLPESGASDVADPAALSRQVGIEGLFRLVKEGLAEDGGEIGQTFFTFLGLAFLTALATGLSSGGAQTWVQGAVGCVTAVVVYEKLFPLLSDVTEALEGTSAFFAAAIPVVSGLVAAGGAETGAAVGAAGMNAAAFAIEVAVGKILTPAVSVLFAMALVGSVGESYTDRLTAALKRWFIIGIGIVATVFSAAVSMQTVLSRSADSAAMRAAGVAASSLIPIVGSTVSGALSTLSAGLSYVRGTVGVAAVYTVLTFTLLPLVRLLAFRLALDLSVGILSLFGAEEAGKKLSLFRHGIDALTATLCLSAIVCIIEIVLFLKCGAVPL